MRIERRKKKWSQEDLARKSGVSQGLISQMENGTNNESKYLTAIARALGVSADWLESGKGSAGGGAVNVPLSVHYPPMIEETLAAVPDPDGTSMILVVFKDENGTPVTLKLDDKAARSLVQKLAEQGK